METFTIFQRYDAGPHWGRRRPGVMQPRLFLASGAAEFCERVKSAAPDDASPGESEQHGSQHRPCEEENSGCEGECVPCGNACSAAAGLVHEYEPDISEKA